ncbi:hypothetical protein [Janthinobacterium sp. GMG1]|uniref:hypothetical protein n=1 Tax=Janthinobacterium sp. GMG1 TaxID=3096007 RepID=UPI002AC9FE2B|nr:hypothetical protein [Janthinobacterium sp. GMG1]MDZ5636210.1 hypothetical protein [Janthinobacterium sp. GMG1]
MTVLALISVLAAGCGSMSNRADAKLAEPAKMKQDEGYVVISTGTNYVDQFGFGVFLTIAPVQAQYRQDELALLAVSSQALKSDFSDHFGLLHAVKLKAGAYQYYQANLDVRRYAISVPNARFHVVAGQVTYLGEFFYTMSLKTRDRSDMRDKEQRDMTLLQQKNSALAALPRIKNIAQYSGYVLKDEAPVEYTPPAE